MIENSADDTAMETHGRILVVDDDEGITILMKDILSSFNYEVATATDCYQALETFRSMPENFDLVISDISMPKMTGLMLAKKMIAMRSDIPIILVSGQYEVTKHELKTLKVREFILKPFNLETLIKAVERHLDHR